MRPAPSTAYNAQQQLPAPQQQQQGGGGGADAKAKAAAQSAAQRAQKVPNYAKLAKSEE